MYCLFQLESSSSHKTSVAQVQPRQDLPTKPRLCHVVEAFLVKLRASKLVTAASEGVVPVRKLPAARLTSCSLLITQQVARAKQDCTLKLEECHNVQALPHTCRIDAGKLPF